jgi:hypothetical protein
MLRQGDVLLRPIEALPEKHSPVKEREDGKIIVALGEATGHKHEVVGEGVEFVKSGARQFLVATMEGTTLVHDEHASIEIPVGTHEIVRQREYAPKAPVRVRD